MLDENLVTRSEVCINARNDKRMIFFPLGRAPEKFEKNLPTSTLDVNKVPIHLLTHGRFFTPVPSPSDGIWSQFSLAVNANTVIQ
jgi:hypothetical protein